MIRVGERTVPRLTPGAASRSGKPTSKNQPARSMRPLSRYKAVIPAVTFRSPLPRTPRANTADRRPAFQPPQAPSRPRVKRALARTRYAPVPSPLRSPLGALATISKACRPSETARLLLSTPPTRLNSGWHHCQRRADTAREVSHRRGREPKNNGPTTPSSLHCTRHAALHTDCCQARTGLLAP